MQTVTLGDGLQVSAVGFGGMALSRVYGGIAPEEALATLHAAVDAGLTFIDTADVYGDRPEGGSGPAGTNEELVGRLLRDRRDEVQLATKFGIVDSAAGGTRGDAEYVRAACEASLRRLKVDRIDLYYMHRRELSRPIEETVGAMAELVIEGKVAHLGLSEVTAEELRAAHSVHPIAAVQSEWSLWSRDVERYVVPAAAELGVGFVPYSPLGRGFLTGTLRKEDIEGSMREGQERFSGEAFEANQRVVGVVRGVADELEATAAQVALAWLLAKGQQFGLGVAPIPGTRSSERVRENAAAAGLSLTADQVTRLDAAAHLVVGHRNVRSGLPQWVSSGRE